MVLLIIVLVLAIGCSKPEPKQAMPSLDVEFILAENAAAYAVHRANMAELDRVAKVKRAEEVAVMVEREERRLSDAAEARDEFRLAAMKAEMAAERAAEESVWRTEQAERLMLPGSKSRAKRDVEDAVRRVEHTKLAKQYSAELERINTLLVSHKTKCVGTTSYVNSFSIEYGPTVGNITTPGDKFACAEFNRLQVRKQFLELQLVSLNRQW